MIQKKERAKRKNKNVSQLDQLDGAVRSGVKSSRSLDEIIGAVPKSPFGTKSKEEFTSRLRDMNLSDLQFLAKKVGAYPDYDRNSLIQSLIKAFCSYEGIKEAMGEKINNKNDITSLSPEARKILSEGA